jgi:Tfp pilus assembly protein PilN
VTTQTEQTAGITAMPRVNLMPPEIAEAERFRRLQLAMGSAVLLAAVVVGALYVHAKSGISAAQTQVTAAQTQQTALQTKLDSLASVKQTFAEVQGKQALLQQAMGQEIRWSYVLNDLSFRVPGNVWLSGIQASETVSGLAGGVTVPGSVATDIGTVSFTGHGLRHDDVATWLDSLAKERGFTEPTFASSVEDAIGPTSDIDFTTTVNIDTKAYSNRYTPKTTTPKAGS